GVKNTGSGCSAPISADFTAAPHAEGPLSHVQPSRTVAPDFPARAHDGLASDSHLSSSRSAYGPSPAARIEGRASAQNGSLNPSFGFLFAYRFRSDLGSLS